MSPERKELVRLALECPEATVSTALLMLEVAHRPNIAAAYERSSSQVDTQTSNVIYLRRPT